jgi:hypothetical protein
MKKEPDIGFVDEATRDQRSDGAGGRRDCQPYHDRRDLEDD